MRITVSQLRRIIKEEVQKITEATRNPDTLLMDLEEMMPRDTITMTVFTDDEQFEATVTRDDGGYSLVREPDGLKELAFGDATDIENKFDRLFAFYKQALPKTGWEKYSSIDLSFRKQIVAKKKL